VRDAADRKHASVGLLASTGVAGCAHEWFLEAAASANRRAWRARDFADYLGLARAAGTTTNGVFGAKVMWAYLADLLDALRDLDDVSDDRTLIAEHFRRPRFVWISRDDLEAQAVSWSRAIQTGYWQQWDSPDSHALPAYDRDQIDALAQIAAEHNAAWQRWFSANDIEPLAIRFEELVAEPHEVTRAALAFLGIAADDVPIAELTASPHDRTSDLWLARHRAEQ
jgi:LPS sulfotransferase NodH